MTRLSAPIFGFGAPATLATLDSYTRPQQLDGMLAMTGPSVPAEPGCLPVRGDLAHIKLAGIHFVPHYAVPMPHVLVSAAQLRAAPRNDAVAVAVADLVAGTAFNVLDIVGGWAWGQVDEDGLVGYLPMSGLTAS